jgi:hypothetical protein
MGINVKRGESGPKFPLRELILGVVDAADRKVRTL